MWDSCQTNVDLVAVLHHLPLTLEKSGPSIAAATGKHRRDEGPLLVIRCRWRNVGGNMKYRRRAACTRCRSLCKSVCRYYF
jgi:hypothetical protein